MRLLRRGSEARDRHLFPLVRRRNGRLSTQQPVTFLLHLHQLPELVWHLEIEFVLRIAAVGYSGRPREGLQAIPASKNLVKISPNTQVSGTQA